METTDTVMRQFVPGRNIKHYCVLPETGGRGRWTCPVCRRVWSVNGWGSGSSDTSGQQVGEIVAFRVRYADGTTATFHVEAEG